MNFQRIDRRLAALAAQIARGGPLKPGFTRGADEKMGFRHLEGVLEHDSRYSPAKGVSAGQPQRAGQSSRRTPKVGDWIRQANWGKFFQVVAIEGMRVYLRSTKTGNKLDYLLIDNWLFRDEATPAPAQAPSQPYTPEVGHKVVRSNWMKDDYEIVKAIDIRSGTLYAESGKEFFLHIGGTHWIQLP